MSLPNIPAAVYETRPLLKELRAEAHRRAVGADAVLWSFLTIAAADAPAQISVDTGIGTPAKLTLYAVLAGRSGTGKSAAWGVARKLYGDGPEPLPLSTGEGMIEAFFGMVPEEIPHPTDPNKPPKIIKVRKRTRSSRLFWLDEGESLFKQAERMGSQLHTTLRGFWSGGTVGQANATEGLGRVLEAGTYAGGLVIGLQPDISGRLLADTATGTAQRFVWTATTDTGIPLSNGTPPGPPMPIQPVPWTRPNLPVIPSMPGPGGVLEALFAPLPPVTITVEPDIALELDTRRRLVAAGREEPDEFDTQRHAMHIKVAAVLAWLDGRLRVTRDDWAIAGELLGASDAVRDALIEHADGAEREDMATEAVRRARARDAESDDRITEQKLRCAKRMNDIVTEHGPIGAAAIRKRLSRAQRPMLAELLENAVRNGVLRAADVAGTGQSGTHYEINSGHRVE
jgi:hypothetical protein